MDKSKRILTFITFFVCTTCLALLSASLATHKWIVVRPLRVSLLNESTIRSYDNSRDDFTSSNWEDSSNPFSGQGSRYNDTEGKNNLEKSLERKKFRGYIHFGLFQGTKVLNYGFGDRPSFMTMKEELLRNPNLMPFGLWVFTVLCLAIAIIFGVVSSIFAIINTVMTPIESISGVSGLYLWNGMGALFSTGACLSWLIQYRTRWRKNVLTSDEIDDGWSSENRAYLGVSFFLVVIALALFLLNIVLVTLASAKRHYPPFPFQRHGPHHHHQQGRYPLASDKNPEGLIMLY